MTCPRAWLDEPADQAAAAAADPIDPDVTAPEVEVQHGQAEPAPPAPQHPGPPGHFVEADPHDLALIVISSELAMSRRVLENLEGELLDNYGPFSDDDWFADPNNPHTRPDEPVNVHELYTTSLRMHLEIIEIALGLLR